MNKIDTKDNTETSQKENKQPSEKKRKIIKRLIRTIIILPFLALIGLVVYAYFAPQEKIGIDSLLRDSETDTAALEQKIKALELWRLSIHDEISEIKQIYEESREVGSNLTGLTAKVNEAYRNIEKIEKESSKGTNSGDILLTLNINNLMYTMTQNSPFNSQIDILIASISSQKNQYEPLIKELTVLKEVSKTGAPNINTLMISFDKVSQSVIAKQDDSKTSFVARFKTFLRNWILIRKVENVKYDENSVDYILKSVEKSLEGSNLEQAIVWFEKLNIEQNSIAKNWLEDAKKRLFINQSMQKIYETTIKIISKTAG